MQEFRIEYVNNIGNREKEVIAEIIETESLQEAWEQACRIHPGKTIKRVARVTHWSEGM